MLCRSACAAISPLRRYCTSTASNQVLRLSRPTLSPNRAWQRKCRHLESFSNSTAATTSTSTSNSNTYRKYAWRVVWMPYALLSIIPISSSIMAAYKWMQGDKDGFRGAAFYALTGFLCLPLSVPVLLGAPFVLGLDPHKRVFMDNIQKLWGRSTTRPFHDTTVEGTSNLDNVGPAVYVSNHQSWLDIYSLYWIDSLHLKIVAKKEIMMIPVIGWVMSVIGHIPFDRKKGGKKLLETCGEMLENGTDVFFFPEGTRTKDGRLQTFKPGAFILAQRHQVPVVPITILNTGDMMPRGQEFWGTPMLREGEVRVIVHPPVMPTTVDGRTKTVQEITKEVHSLIGSKL